MTSQQFTSPITVAPTGESDVLEQIRLARTDTAPEYNEAWLRDLLFEHPEALPIEEIDRAFAGAVPVCKELNTPAGAVDALYATPEGKLVVLEAKLWRNPDARRTVVGQILDYATALSRWTYTDLQREITRRTGHHGNALFDVVSGGSGGLDEASFIDEVSRNLRQGRFLLLICGDGIREGVAMIADFLARHGTLQFTFGLVEIAVYRMPSGGHLVQPRVLAQSLIVKRTVIELASEEMTAVEEDDGDESLDDLAAYYKRFWTDFRKKLVLDDTAVPLPNPSTKGNVFITMPKGSGSWITVFCNKGHERVGVFLTFYRGALGDRIFERLAEDRERIDAEIGVPVDWVTSGGRHRIHSRKRFPDIRDPEYRDDIHAFLADRANRFVNTFRHRIERIVEGL